MNVTINIIFLSLIIIYGFKDAKTSILLYVIGTFIAPVFRVAGLGLSFDIWCFPVILVIYLLRKGTIAIKDNSVSLVPFLVIYVFLSLINAVIFRCGISIATIYAIIRFIITINIIKVMWNGELIKFTDKALGSVIIINTACVVVQMMNLVSVETFFDLYYKETMKPLLIQMQIGYFNRAYGTTGSPVILGGISALTYTFYLSAYVNGKYKIRGNTIKLIACIICGILALSKTAIFAIPIITLFIMVICTVSNESKHSKGLLKILLLVFMGGIILSFIIPWMEEKEFAIAYYLKFLSEPMEALSTRYDGNSGILAETMAIVKDNFLFGVGHALFDGVFIGDSLYIVLLYHTGIVGLMAYLYPYIIVFFRTIKKKDLIKSSLTIVFFLIGIGNSIFASCWVVPFVAIMFEEE